MNGWHWLCLIVVPFSLSNYLNLGEEKIYSRSVNKTGLALRLLDGKNIAKSFTEAELSNLVLNDTWVSFRSSFAAKIDFVIVF